MRAKKLDDRGGGQADGSCARNSRPAGSSPQALVISIAVIAGRINDRVGTTDSY